MEMPTGDKDIQATWKLPGDINTRDDTETPMGDGDIEVTRGQRSPRMSPSSPPPQTPLPRMMKKV